MGADAKHSHVEDSEGPRTRLPCVASSPKSGWTGGSLVALGCRRRLDEVVPGFTRAPNRPNQSSRGPPCGNSQEQPHQWYASPTPFSEPRHLPALLRPKGTQRRPPASILLSSELQHLFEARRFLDLPRKTWWGTRSRGPMKS